MENAKTVEVEIYYVLKNCGDGSAAAIFFRTKKEKNKYAKELEADEYSRFSEPCDGSLKFSVNAETGKVVVIPTHSKWEQPFQEDRK